MIKKCSGYVRQAAVATAGVNSNPGRPCRSAVITYLQGSTSIFILLPAVSSEFDFFPFSFFFFFFFFNFFFYLFIFV